MSIQQKEEGRRKKEEGRRKNLTDKGEKKFSLPHQSSSFQAEVIVN
ncbi:MAG: hypothetical protein F6K48_20875 [Okeania sp. SIO3H1]|nr:hypothetical protein [Okeania sp. SIO1I7]NEN91224.1 hypothetical protein [Okeania sp. SIO3H1]NET26746.1 hypothetical protein [Okeania sp. SIO1I7]